MAANKKKQDEKHLKMLREMVTFPSNKQCFDCNQRGPTYVNMTVGSFVCTSCSGILRGLHPPHRIKSISMASFTPEEMDFLKSHGNELNKKVYLGLYDGQTVAGPDSRDEQRVRDYMIQKYEQKRWYVAPTDAMQEEAKWTNEAALNSKPQARPLRSLLGENATKHTAGSVQTTPTSHVPVHVSVPLPGDFKSPPATITQTHIPAATAPSKASSGFDFLGDLGGDPFASSAPAGNSNGNVDGFADFSNFGNMNTSPTHQSTVAPAHVPVVLAAQAFPVSSTPLQPSAKGQTSTPTTSQQSPAQSFSLGGDRYAALDGFFTAPVTAAVTSVNWGGTDGGAINWGGTSSTAGTPSRASSGPINWNTQGSHGATVGTTGSSSSGFGVTSNAVNPFSGGPVTGMSPFSGSAPSSAVNPFGAAGGVTQFSQTGMPVGSGYGGQFAGPGQVGGFGQFPAVQNGGFNMSSPATGYGGSFTQQQFMMPSQTAGVVQQAGGWGQFGPPSQPVSNPFMNTGTHQQVPPHSGSTNPFL